IGSPRAGRRAGTQAATSPLRYLPPPSQLRCACRAVASSACTQPMERVHRAPSTLFLVFSRKPRPLRTEGPHPPLSPRSSSLLTLPLLRADLRVSAPPRQDHTLAISHFLPATGSSVALNSALVCASALKRIPIADSRWRRGTSPLPIRVGG